MNYSGSYAIPRLDLGEAMLEYIFSPMNFIGTKVFTPLQSQVKEGSFTKVTRESLLRRRNVKRAKRSAYSRDEFEGKDDSFSCVQYGHEQPLDDEERAFYANDLDAELQSSQLATNVVLMEQEIRIASKCIDTGNFTAGFLTTTLVAWSNPAAKILGTVREAKEAIRKRTGIKPDTLVVNEEIFGYMLINDEIVGRLGNLNDKTEDRVRKALAAILGLEDVLVAPGVYNAADEGQTFNGTDVWASTHAFLCKVGRTKSPAEPCIGRTIWWAKLSNENAMIKQYREQQTDSEIFRASQFTDEKLIDKNYGQLIKLTP